MTLYREPTWSEVWESTMKASGGDDAGACKAADDAMNAKRIREAAPDLLDACKRAEMWLTTVPDSFAMAEVLRKAVDKAEGRTT